MSGVLKTPRPPSYPKPRLAASNNQAKIWGATALLEKISKFLSTEDKKELSYLSNYFWRNRDFIIGFPLPKFFKEKLTEENLQIRLAEHCLELLGIPHPPDQALSLSKSFSNTVAQYCINLEARLEPHLLPDCSHFLWASLYGSFPKAALGFYLQQFVQKTLNPHTGFHLSPDLALFHDILSILSALNVLSRLTEELDQVKDSTSHYEENTPLFRVVEETLLNFSRRHASPRILFIVQHLKGWSPTIYQDFKKKQHLIATSKITDLSPADKNHIECYGGLRSGTLMGLLYRYRESHAQRLSKNDIQEYLWQAFSRSADQYRALPNFDAAAVYKEYRPLIERFDKFSSLLKREVLNSSEPSWQIEYNSRRYPLSNTSDALNYAIIGAELLLPGPIKQVYIENWRTISCYTSPFSSVDGQAAAIHPYFLMLIGLSISSNPFKLEREDMPVLITSAIPWDYNICRQSEQTYATYSEEDILNLFRRLPSDDHLAELNGRYYALSLIFKKFNKINLHNRCLLAIKLLHNEFVARHPSKEERSAALKRDAQDYSFGTLSETSIEDFCAHAHTQKQEKQGTPPPVMPKLTPPKLLSRFSKVREYVYISLWGLSLLLAALGAADGLAAGIVWLPSFLSHSFICPLLLASGSTMALCLLAAGIVFFLAIFNSPMEAIIRSKLRYINAVLIFACLLTITETTLLAMQTIANWTLSIVVHSTQATVLVGPNMLAATIGVLACLLTVLYILYKINTREKIQPPKPMLRFDVNSKAKDRLSAQALKQPSLNRAPPVKPGLITGWGAQTEISRQVKTKPRRRIKTGALGSLQNKT